MNKLKNSQSITKNFINVVDIYLFTKLCRLYHLICSYLFFNMDPDNHENAYYLNIVSMHDLA